MLIILIVINCDCTSHSKLPVESKPLNKKKTELYTFRASKHLFFCFIFFLFVINDETKAFTFSVFSQIEVIGSVKLHVSALCKQRCASYIMQKKHLFM